MLKHGGIIAATLITISSRSFHDFNICCEWLPDVQSLVADTIFLLSFRIIQWTQQKKKKNLLCKSPIFFLASKCHLYADDVQKRSRNLSVFTAVRQVGRVSASESDANWWEIFLGLFIWFFFFFSLKCQNWEYQGVINTFWPHATGIYKNQWKKQWNINWILTVAVS